MSAPAQPRLLVVGATGYIGARLMAQARRQGMDATGTSSSGRAGTLQLDLAEPHAMDLSPWNQGDLALVTAAISAPDVCANDKPLALAVNVSGTGELVAQLLARGVRVAFFSSDTVYGEQSEPFDESGAVRPAGDYAFMKHQLEERFLGHPGFKSLRLSYVFSSEDKFTRYLGSCAGNATTAEIFDPFDRSVIHRDDVVDGALALASVQAWSQLPHPVLNFGGPATLSRVAFAEALRSLVWPTLLTRVVTPPPSFFENRPRRIAMKSPLLTQLLGRQPRTLAEAMALEFPNPKESSLA
jgi:dTDP-4-dehydrorhamnose reductase